MRIDIVTIFPAYLAPLELSLPGKARAAGLVDLEVHDLRRWTHDKHRSVDDAPYGGGAGMVMRPEPWGEALDELVAEGTQGTVVVVPTPSGERLSQPLAAELARARHLVLACGRYEGIDQRVVDHFARRLPVREISLGDYVLNGGEVAALAIVEAVVRLLPGFLGNPDSLAEESHGEDALLEYPVYTRPTSWRGLDVPGVLLGGDHAAIAGWRHQQAVRRTAERRPDLAHPSRVVAVEGLGAAEVRTATPADLGELQTLQWACCGIARRQSIDALAREVESATTLLVRVAGRLVGAVRGRLEDGGAVWDMGLLLVAPDLRGRGLGRFLLESAEAAAPGSVSTYRLLVESPTRQHEPTRLYRRSGYSTRGRHAADPDLTVLTKARRPAGSGR